MDKITEKDRKELETLNYFKQDEPFHRFELEKGKVITTLKATK